MRDILEELPNALMPDLALESEAPGVLRDLVDDDLVRPAAEEDLQQDSGRSKRSPLARHVELMIDPFDPSLSTTIGVRLSVEGARLRAIAIDAGYVHQGLERRAVGLPVDSPLLSALVGLAEPALVTQLAVARAVERLGGRDASTSTTAWRHLALDLSIVAENARVLTDVARSLPRLQQTLRDVVAAARAAMAGLVVGERFGAPFRLRAPIFAEERETLARRLADVDAAARAVDEDRFSRVLARLTGAGILDLDAARRFGVDGPVLRAAGGDDEFPVDLGDVGVGADTGKGTSGCTAARVRVRIADLRGAVRRAIGGLAIVDRHNADNASNFHVAALNGIADAVIRGPNGSTSCLVYVQAGMVKRLRLRPADLPLLAAVPAAMRGVLLDDVAEVLASFGLRATAIDR